MASDAQRMQIIVPMSGYGERFRRAGYRVPKPLIEVEGKPIIGHVVDLFPGESDFVFVCNREHLQSKEFRLEETLRALCPTGRVLGIEPHKLGPVHAVAQAFDLLDPARPAIVNYCDFACVWDYEGFKRFVADTGVEGAIPCYTGFHPHMLGSTNYAYVRTENGRVVAIQEKQPYTDHPEREYASSGTYYFATAALMREAFERTLARADLQLNGEFYASLAYRPLLEDRRQIAVYELEHFMQWGTPEDLADYRYWSDVFRVIGTRGPRSTARQRGAVLVPMAGLGSRFAQDGYALPKPLIPVSGQPMVAQAVRDLPMADLHCFVVRADLPGLDVVEFALDVLVPGCLRVTLPEVTDGQARSCLLGMAVLDLSASLTIGACDNGSLYDERALQVLIDDPDVDVIVWVARGYPGAIRRPEHFGWVRTEGDWVTGMSVKQPLGDPATDPLVIGTFTFKRGADFVAAAQSLIARGGCVNGEYYVDSCIEDALALGLRCRIFEVDHYLCWGTPDDLRTFNYWQACFHRWTSHPYRTEADSRFVPATLEARAPVADRSEAMA